MTAPPECPTKRLPDESDEAYSHFRTFLKQGTPRRLAITAEQLGVSYSWVCKMSAAHDWLARARAYDEWIRLHEVSGLQKAAEEMAAAQLRVLGKIRFLCEQKINALVNKCHESAGKGREVTTREVIEMLKLAIHYERLILGEATERTESKSERVDLSTLTDEELRALDELQKKAMGNAE